MVERWNRAVDEGKVHICTCVDMCGWQPCPYTGKELPIGCPEREYSDDDFRGMDLESLMNLYQNLIYQEIKTKGNASTISRLVRIIEERKEAEH